MNERIQELIEQAGYIYDGGLVVPNMEKFAELIVNDMMVHLAAHALSGTSAMDVYVQWKEMYEGETIDRGPAAPLREINDMDF